MGQEIELEPDYESIDPDTLSVYLLAPRAGGESGIHAFSVESVHGKSPVTNSEEVREYDVEIEFRPDNYGLELGSLSKYLHSYRNASISQESMASLIREHLMAALDIDSVFVEVKDTGLAEKRVLEGRP